MARGRARAEARLEKAAAPDDEVLEVERGWSRRFAASKRTLTSAEP